MTNFLHRACLPTLLAVTLFAVAASAQQATKTAADPRAGIAQKFPGLKAEDVRSSALPGIYEVTLGADTVYVSADGKYLIAGDMYEGSSSRRRR
jgi:thiol:disulfide interchange protein DsbC